MTNFLVGVFSGLAVLITSVLRVSCCPRNVYKDYSHINMQCGKSYESRHEISNNVVCATSKGSDQPAHKRSLIRAFASRLDIL